MITGIRVLFIEKEFANLGESVRSSRRKSLRGGEPKKRNNSVFCTGCQLFQCNHLFQKIGKNIAKKFRLALVEERFVEEPEKKGPTFGITQQGGQSSRSPNALPFEQLAHCADFVEANMEFARQNAWDLHKKTYQVEWTISKHVKISSEFPTGLLK